MAKVRMLLHNLFEPIMALSVQSIHIFTATLYDGKKNTLDDTQLHTRIQTGPKDEHLALF